VLKIEVTLDIDLCGIKKKITMSKFIHVLLLSLVWFGAAAQLGKSGAIVGTVLDGKTHEPLIGVIVMLDETGTGAETDLDGRFVIEQVAVGAHTLRATLMSYKPEEIKVDVDADVQNSIDFTMSEETQQISEVTVTATRRTNTEQAVLVETKKAEQVVSAVSAQQIAKTQDRDAAQVVKRVPGISIIDDKFIVVRGLNERYNTVLINDVVAPNTEVDTKSFAFDLIPSSAIDRMVVYKSAAADLPADFAGGAVRIYTRSQPDTKSLSVGFSVGYRGGATLQEATTYRGGKLDWLGFDDGTRALPRNFPSRSYLNTGSTEALQYFRDLPKYFDTYTTTLMPDVRFNLGYNHVGSIGGKKISSLHAINYTNTNSLPTNANQQRYEGMNNDELALTYTDRLFTNTVRIGAISNWALNINDKTKLEFRNLLNQVATKETLERTGQNQIEGLDLLNYAFRYETKSIASSQLGATYKPNDRTKFNWVLGGNYTNRYEPDYRRISTSRPIGSTEQSFKIDIPQTSNASLLQAARFYSALNAYSATLAANFEKTIGGNEASGKEPIKFKAGIYNEYKARHFNARWFGYINPRNAQVTNLPLSQFFDPLLITNNAGGVKMAEGTNYDDKYSAQNIQSALYSSINVPLGKLHVIAGIRGEYNQQQLQSRLRGSGDEVNVNNPQIAPLPSLNLTYNINDKNLLRAGYGITVNRPEFRELAPFSYYDFTLAVSKTGNPDLLSATIQNFDIRYELYPAEGQSLSLGAFYKHFNNPIELMGRASGSGVAFYYNNPQTAKALGSEVELRQSLAFIKPLQNLSLLLNASYMYSRVDASNLEGQIADRPLQGTSPYLVNAGLFYNHKSLSANILYNVIGQRIYVVGDLLGNETIFEMPRHVIDLNVTKTIGKQFEIRLAISDLLNQPVQFTADSNADLNITDTDKNWRTFQRGSYATLGITYKFDK
jgi:hypothetical protein